MNDRFFISVNNLFSSNKKLTTPKETVKDVYENFSTYALATRSIPNPSPFGKTRQESPKDRSCILRPSAQQSYSDIIEPGEFPGRKPEPDASQQ